MAELEGFLCPLCMGDCRSVLELEAHYREEHAESASSKLKVNLLNFVDLAKTTLKMDKSPKAAVTQGASRGPAIQDLDGGSFPGVMESVVTNVSGISTELWTSQKMGWYFG